MKSLRIFDFENYKSFSLKQIEQFPKKGRGQLQKLAHFLNVHPTLVSQVFRGSKNLTSEQACRVAEFFELNSPEGEFYLALVERERAGIPSLKKYWQSRIEKLRQENQVLANRLKPAHELTQANQFQFYSSWEYSGVRMGTSVPSLQNPEHLADRLGLSLKKTKEILRFLIEVGLCVESNGRITIGPTMTHIKTDSPSVNQHHLNWRLKALEAHTHLRPHELAFTSPLSIARRDQGRVREILLQAIERVSGMIEKTTPEEISCLTLDWFDVRTHR